VTGSGTRSLTFEIDYQDRGATFTFTGTADDGQASSRDSATIRVDYPGGCDPQELPENSPPSIGVGVSKPNPIVACPGSNVLVTVTYTANDTDNDVLTGTLVARAETRAGAPTGDFDASQDVTTPAGGGSGSKTFTVPVTESMIGDWIRVTLTLDDGTVSNYGTSRVEVQAGPNCPPTDTSSSTTAAPKNTAPKVSYALTTTYDEKNSSCTVQVTATDAEGDLVFIGEGSKFIQDSFFTGKSPKTRTYTIELAPGDTGSLPSHFAVDQKNAATTLSYTVTVKYNAPVAGNTPTYTCVRV
jgi:hypothetical protein